MASEQNEQSKFDEIIEKLDELIERVDGLDESIKNINLTERDYEIDYE